jgi:hypothetical protein
VARHLRFGWWSILVFVCVGLGLETLHGFKVGWYVDPGSEARRLMCRELISRCLMAATVLIPAGFFLGGCYIYAGDPGLAVLLVPAGAALLITAVALIVR